MAKRVVGDAAVTGEGGQSLATLWAAALSLAMLTTAFANGVGALAGCVALSVVIWSLARLRSRAPTARSTSDLIGVVLGDRASTMVALLQTCAYLFLAWNAAAALGFVATRVAPWMADPIDEPDPLWWPTSSAVAVLLATAVVYTVSTRAVAAICAVLAAAAALIGVSLATMVLVEVSGEAGPMPVYPHPTGLAAVNLVLLAGLTVVGLELITTANSRLRSVTRPMRGALIAATACIALIWVASQVATTGGFFYQVDRFSLMVEGYFGGAGVNWLVAMTACVQTSALLAVTWALRRLLGRIGEHFTANVDIPRDLAGALILVPACVIGVIAVCLNWAALTPLAPSVAPVLLVLVYAFVAEASARLPQRENLTRVIKVLTLVALAAVVLVPLLDVFAPSASTTHPLTAADVLVRTTVAGLVVAAAAAGVSARWPRLVGVETENTGANSDGTSFSAESRR